jgi:tRNA 2-selenouridine synthase
MRSDVAGSGILDKTSRQLDVDEAVRQGCRLVDVRSAAEFALGKVPGAVNIPLFDEDERSVIGTLYKHGGRDQAVDKGFSIAGEKLAELMGAFAEHSGRKIAVYCARGGMRSLSVVNLLRQSGYEAYQIEGGYKRYRHDVLERLDSFHPRLIVIHGLTGVGKTRLLERLNHAIDLEELARHRSSLFGGLDRPPSNQRDFESKLAGLIGNLGAEPYFIEGESRKIGRVFIPKPLAKAMKKGVLVNVHCSLETRVDRILEDYPVDTVEKRERIDTILKSLRQKLGAQKVELMCSLLHRGELAELVRILLVDYYDRRYERSMSSYVFDLELSSEDLDAAAARLNSFRKRHVHAGAAWQPSS